MLGFEETGGHHAGAVVPVYKGLELLQDLELLGLVLACGLDLVGYVGTQGVLEDGDLQAAGEVGCVLVIWFIPRIPYSLIRLIDNRKVIHKVTHRPHIRQRIHRPTRNRKVQRRIHQTLRLILRIHLQNRLPQPIIRNGLIIHDHQIGQLPIKINKRLIRIMVDNLKRLIVHSIPSIENPRVVVHHGWGGIHQSETLYGEVVLIQEDLLDGGLGQEGVLCEEDGLGGAGPVDLVDRVGVGEGDLEGVVEVVREHAEFCEALGLVAAGDYDLLVDGDVHTVETPSAVK